MRRTIGNDSGMGKNWRRLPPAPSAFTMSIICSMTHDPLFDPDPGEQSTKTRNVGDARTSPHPLAWSRRRRRSPWTPLDCRTSISWSTTTESLEQSPTAPWTVMVWVMAEPFPDTMPVYCTVRKVWVSTRHRGIGILSHNKSRAPAGQAFKYTGERVYIRDFRKLCFLTSKFEIVLPELT